MYKHFLKNLFCCLFLRFIFHHFSDEFPLNYDFKTRSDKKSSSKYLFNETGKAFWKLRCCHILHSSWSCQIGAASSAKQSHLVSIGKTSLAYESWLDTRLWLVCYFFKLLCKPEVFVCFIKQPRIFFRVSAGLNHFIVNTTFNYVV